MQSALAFACLKTWSELRKECSDGSWNTAQLGVGGEAVRPGCRVSTEFPIMKVDIQPYYTYGLRLLFSPLQELRQTFRRVC